jgi:hypothetical protein
LSPLSAPTTVSVGVPALHPDFAAVQDGPDVAVLYLLIPVPMAAYGELPDEGMLSDMAVARGPLADRFFRTVGYGVDGVSGYVSQGKPGLQVFGLRRFGEQSLINVNGATSFGGLYARFSANNGRLSGGDCFGDSGGPVFFGDTNVIAAVNSFGTNTNCAGTTNSSRLDVGSVLDFIDAFLP